MLKFSGKTTDTDLGIGELLKQLSLVDGAISDVGIFDHEEHPESEEYTVAQIGAVHEFGSKDGKTPERSFVRSTHDEQEQKWRKRMDDGFNKVLLGKAKVLPVLFAWGERAAGDVRRKITTLKTPPKAPATIKAQGGLTNNPLIWLGYMRAAVRSRVTVGGREKMTAKGSR